MNIDIWLEVLWGNVRVIWALITGKRMVAIDEEYGYRVYIWLPKPNVNIVMFWARRRVCSTLRRDLRDRGTVIEMDEAWLFNYTQEHRHAAFTDYYANADEDSINFLRD